MSKKVLIIPITIALLLMTACGSSKLEAPIAVDEQVASDQSSETSESSVTNDSTESTESNTPSSSSTTTESSESADQTSTDSADTANTQEPYIFPDFTLQKLDGTSAQLYDFKDKVIVINFWATWCHYCDQEMPLIETLSKNDQYQVLAINVGEDSDTIQKYLDEKGLSLDVYLDEDQSLAGQFSVTGFPTSVFIGPDFEYLYAYPGMLDQKTLDSILTSIDDYLAQ